MCDDNREKEGKERGEDEIKQGREKVDDEDMRNERKVFCMKNQPIITIGRQYGSGGRYVAKLLAERLGIPYYDKELLTEASKDSGICKELLESYDEKQGKNLLFSLISGAQVRSEPGAMYMDMPLNHKIFLAQFDTIRRIADEGSCVIVGQIGRAHV